MTRHRISVTVIESCCIRHKVIAERSYRLYAMLEELRPYLNRLPTTTMSHFNNVMRETEEKWQEEGHTQE